MSPEKGQFDVLPPSKIPKHQPVSLTSMYMHWIDDMKYTIFLEMH